MHPYQQAILYGLNRLNKHIYEGTVSPKTIAHRRARNKMARASRKVNHG